MSSKWEADLYREQDAECDARANRFADDRTIRIEQARRWRELADIAGKEGRPNGALAS